MSTSTNHDALDTHLNDPGDNARRRQQQHFNGSPEETAGDIPPVESIADADDNQGTTIISNDVPGMPIPPPQNLASVVGARSVRVEPPESEAGSIRLPPRPTSLYGQYVEHVPDFPPIHRPIPRRGQSMSTTPRDFERPRTAPLPSDPSWGMRQPFAAGQHSLHPPPRVPSRMSPSYQKAVDPAGNFGSDIHPVRFISERNGENGGILAVVKELTAWDIYNNEAKKVDIELVKDWRDSLNSLLVFAAIFAAVLTGFIIESKKLLEEDTAELLVEVTLFNINNMGNSSNLPFVRRAFEPSPTDISINCLLFASLGASLVAALASVVALQWVADYDTATTRGGSTPEDRARRRQFHFAGIVGWKMGEIIAALPLLLYSSVALFWAGAVLWIWTIHSSVGYVVIGGMAIAVLFYASTTLLAAIYVSAPFRTPLSRGIYWTFYTAVYVSAPFRRGIYWTFHHIMPPTISRWLAKVTPVLIHWFLKWFLRIILSPIAVTAFIVGGYHPGIWSASLLGILFRPETRAHFLPWTGRYSLSRQREDHAATAYPLVRHDALGWLANQLNISVDSYPHLLTLLREVLYLSPETTLAQGFQEAPWRTILDSLSRHYIGKIFSGTISENDYEVVRILLRCSTVPGIASQILPSDQYETDQSTDTYWMQHPFTPNQDVDAPDSPPESMIYLLTRDVPFPTSHSKNELVTTMEFIKWRNSTGVKNVDIWMHIFRHSTLYSPQYLQSCLECLHNSFRFLHRQPSSWWLDARSEETHYAQAIKLIEEIDNFMSTTDMIPEYHGDLVALIGRDMDASWLSPSSCPDNLRQRLFRIRDPCLAILGGYACGIPIAVKDKLVPPYIDKYSGSLASVQTLLERGSLNTPRADWDPSAASRLDLLHRTELFWRKTLETPKKDVDAMEHLPVIQSLLHSNFRDLIGCQDHSSGSHHALFHMYMVSSSASFLVRFDKWREVSNVNLAGEWLNPVLVLLALPDAEGPWTLGDDLTESSIKLAREVCSDAQGKPDVIFPLLTDIATEQIRRRSCDSGVMALIQRLVNNAKKIKNVEGTVTEPPEQLKRTLEALEKVMEAARNPEPIYGQGSPESSQPSSRSPRTIVIPGPTTHRRSRSRERRRIIRPRSLSRSRSRSPVIIGGQSRRHRSRSPQPVIIAAEYHRYRSRSPQQVVVAGPSERSYSFQPIIIDGDGRRNRGLMSSIFGGSRRVRVNDEPERIGITPNNIVINIPPTRSRSRSRSRSPRRRSSRYRDSPTRRYSIDGSYSPHIVDTSSRPSRSRRGETVAVHGQGSPSSRSRDRSRSGSPIVVPATGAHSSRHHGGRSERIVMVGEGGGSRRSRSRSPRTIVVPGPTTYRRSRSRSRTRIVMQEGDRPRSRSWDGRRIIWPRSLSRSRSRSPVIIGGESRRYRSRSPQQVIIAAEYHRYRSRSPPEVIVAGPSERRHAPQPIIVDRDGRRSRPGLMSRIFGGIRRVRVNDEPERIGITPNNIVINVPPTRSRSPSRRSSRYRDSPTRRYSIDGSYSPHIVDTSSRPSRSRRGETVVVHGQGSPSSRSRDRSRSGSPIAVATGAHLSRHHGGRSGRIVMVGEGGGSRRSRSRSPRTIHVQGLPESSRSRSRSPRTIIIPGPTTHRRSRSRERRRIIRPRSLSRSRSRSPVIIGGEFRRHRSRSPQQVIIAADYRRYRSRSPQEVVVSGPSERPRSSQPIIINGDGGRSRGLMSRIFGSSRRSPTRVITTGSRRSRSHSPRRVLGRRRSRTPPVIVDADRPRSHSPSRRYGSPRERSPHPIIIADSRRSRSRSPRRFERRSRSPLRIFEGDVSRRYGRSRSRSPRRRRSYSPRTRHQGSRYDPVEYDRFTRLGSPREGSLYDPEDYDRGTRRDSPQDGSRFVPEDYDRKGTRRGSPRVGSRYGQEEYDRGRGDSPGRLRKQPGQEPEDFDTVPLRSGRPEPRRLTPSPPRTRLTRVSPSRIVSPEGTRTAATHTLRLSPKRPVAKSFHGVV